MSAVVSLRLGALVGLLVLIAGCSSPPSADAPKTYPVKGKVVYESGGGSPNGGTVEFQSTTSEEHRSIGDVQPDGTFALRMILQKGEVPGAVEGPHKVTFTPLLTADQNEPVITELPRPLVVKPDDSNDFTIKVKKK